MSAFAVSISYLYIYIGFLMNIAHVIVIDIISALNNE